MIFALDGIEPKIHPSAYIAPTAVLIGDVTVEANASIWFNTVLRGDSGPIVIGEGSNVQDGSVLHEETIIGKNCTLGHQVLVHKAVLGDGVMVANGALVFQDSKVGDGAIIGAGAVLVGPIEVPPRTLWLGIPAKQSRDLNERQLEMVRRTAENYQNRRGQYLAGLKRLD